MATTETPIQANLQMSMQSLNSQEQLEHALRDLIQTTGNRRGWCHGEPITDAGKRRQLTKIIVLILAPVCILIGVALYFVSTNIMSRSENISVRTRVEFSVELGRLIHTLQIERDQSVLYLSAIGPETKRFLSKRYIDTDHKLQDLTQWPVDFDINKKEHFVSKRAFQKHLSNHRTQLDLLGNTIQEEISFYSSSINVFTRWLYNTVTESRYGVAWKSLVAYQKLVMCKDDVGVERALGATFFSQGGFLDHNMYEMYNQMVNTFRYNFRSATNYSPLGNPISTYRLETANAVNLSVVIAEYREQIQSRNISAPSLRKAGMWFDAMTLYIDLLLEIQQELSQRILGILDNRTNSNTSGISVSCLLVTIVIAMCPFLLRSVYKLTNNIHGYALTLADKTKELNREKRRTDSLLYQMFPRSVADQLKNKKDVNAEYFKEITIFFSDIVGFSRQSCTPMQIVELLNDVYTLLDLRIEIYDVYKVETIGDSYMVVSGLPQKNGNRHASEIASMALDIQATCSDLEIDVIPGRKLQLRIGIHSGPVVAGVVGTKCPRYCLFGDTVNTASHMETNRLPSSIHISHTTHKILARHGGYVFQVREPIDIKGKGRMVTYWLLGRKTSTQNSLSKMHSQSSTESGPQRRMSHPQRWARESEDTPTVLQPGPDDKHSTAMSAGRRLSRQLPVLEELSPTLNKIQGGSSNEPRRSRLPVVEEPPPPLIEKSIQPLPYEDLERQIEAANNKDQIVQLVEGYHF